MRSGPPSSRVWGARVTEAEGRTIAAVDLGSNSFHLVVAQLRPDARDFVVIDRLKQPVRLRMGLDESGRLQPEAQSRALACLSRFGERLADIPRGDVRAVGTNTLRSARNSLPFLVRARRALGHKIEVISGLDEARLIYRGVARDLAGTGRRLVVDIGGGSTELIIGDGREPSDLDSLEMGCVSWTLRHFPDGHLTHKGFQKAVVAARLELEAVVVRLRSLGWGTAVGASGTIKAVDKVVHAMLGHPEITPAGLRAVVDAVVACRHVDRLRLPGLRDVRRPVFAGGLAVLCAVVDSLGIERMTAAQGALREGVLLDLLGRLHHDDVRDDTVARLGVRFGVDPAQAERVRATALRFFDQVQTAWSLTSHRHRRLLAWAADLHECGIFIDHRSHHRHGAYLLRHADLPGFSRQDQQALAALVRLHRGSFTEERVREGYDGRPGPILRLGVLLRLAAGLHRSRQAIEGEVGLSARGGLVEIFLPEGYLDVRPLSSADLRREAVQLEAAGFRLRSSVRRA